MIHEQGIQSLEELDLFLKQLGNGAHGLNRPFIMVSYAQCLDGSIATRDRKPIPISGETSMRLTHQLRSLFDAILVGINTVLADNPRLNVRLVPGEDPRPVVLDTHLRISLNSHLLQRKKRRVWLASSVKNSSIRMDEVVQTGASVLTCNEDDRAQIDLSHLLEILSEKGINCLMVEGGAQVISSFIRAKLVDLFVVTISPKLIGGLQVVESLGGNTHSLLNLKHIHYEPLGEDLILWGQPKWDPV
jgi:3,4-dihydroxy 2-butanone 4-phosphate synthase/GTP cyclohydrolase II